MSDVSSCSFCRRVFPTERIVEWLDGGRTPACPLCGVDSVAAGEASPEELLQRYRCGFGHCPDEADPLELRALQRLSERLTAGEEVGQADLLDAIRWRAKLVAASVDLDDESDANDAVFVALLSVDGELKPHRGRFQALAPATRREAWRAATVGVEHMPYWCRPEGTPPWPLQETKPEGSP